MLTAIRKLLIKLIWYNISPWGEATNAKYAFDVDLAY